MNLAIRGMDFNLGKEPADTFTRDQHPDLRADYIMANPPFNISDWWNEKLAWDARWAYGVPPVGNANYAWLSHILYHLKPSGLAGVVLANGSMSSNQNSEGAIRREMIESDVVDCMVALPPQLFFNTQIPACLWFLTKDKRANGRDRHGEILFIDARKLGHMDTRVTRVFDEADIAKIAAAYHAWRTDDETIEKYQDIPGFVYAATKEEVKAQDYVLTPGRYVGVEETENNEEAFSEKMIYLTQQLKEQMEEGEELDEEIHKQLKKVGYGW
jgi:type I restriction enzyme M protein